MAELWIILFLDKLSEIKEVLEPLGMSKMIAFLISFPFSG